MGIILVTFGIIAMIGFGFYFAWREIAYATKHFKDSTSERQDKQQLERKETMPISLISSLQTHLVPLAKTLTNKEYLVWKKIFEYYCLWQKSYRSEHKGKHSVQYVAIQYNKDYLNMARGLKLAFDLIRETDAALVESQDWQVRLY